MSKTRHPVVRTFSARFSPAAFITWHSHAWHQLVYASEGAITVESETACWLVPARRGVWIPADKGHQIRMHGRVFLQSIYMKRAPKSLGRSECKVVNVSSLLHELLVHICRLGIVRGDTPAARNLIQFLQFQLRTMPTVPLLITFPRDERARRLAERIISEPGSDRTLAELSKECSTSLRTMQRIFRDEVRIPLGRWRHQVRMLHAVRLLAGGSNVTQASLELGFESLSAFIQSFRNHFGETPGNYLKQMSQGANPEVRPC